MNSQNNADQKSERKVIISQNKRHAVIIDERNVSSPSVQASDKDDKPKTRTDRRIHNEEQNVSTDGKSKDKKVKKSKDDEDPLVEEEGRGKNVLEDGKPTEKKSKKEKKRISNDPMSEDEEEVDAFEGDTEKDKPKPRTDRRIPKEDQNVSTDGKSKGKKGKESKNDAELEVEEKKGKNIPSDDKPKEKKSKKEKKSISNDPMSEKEGERAEEEEELEEDEDKNPMDYKPENKKEKKAKDNKPEDKKEKKAKDIKPEDKKEKKAKDNKPKDKKSEDGEDEKPKGGKPMSQYVKEGEDKKNDMKDQKKKSKGGPETNQNDAEKSSKGKLGSSVPTQKKKAREEPDTEYLGAPIDLVESVHKNGIDPLKSFILTKVDVESFKNTDFFRCSLSEEPIPLTATVEDLYNYFFITRKTDQMGRALFTKNLNECTVKVMILFEEMTAKEYTDYSGFMNDFHAVVAKVRPEYVRSKNAFQLPGSVNHDFRIDFPILVEKEVSIDLTEKQLETLVACHDEYWNWKDQCPRKMDNMEKELNKKNWLKVKQVLDAERRNKEEAARKEKETEEKEKARKEKEEAKRKVKTRLKCHGAPEYLVKVVTRHGLEPLKKHFLECLIKISKSDEMKQKFLSQLPSSYSKIVRWFHESTMEEFYNVLIVEMRQQGNALYFGGLGDDSVFSYCGQDLVYLEQMLDPTMPFREFMESFLHLLNGSLSLRQMEDSDRVALQNCCNTFVRFANDLKLAHEKAKELETGE